MKTTKYLSLILLATVALFASCIKDESNSILTDFENEFGKNTIIELEFDSVRAGGSNMDPFTWSASLSPGQHIGLPIKVKYAYPQNLKYTWVVLPYKAGRPKTYQVGNKLVYADADTIANTKDLEFDVNLAPDNYQFYLIAEDTITGLSGSYKAVTSFQGVEVVQEGFTQGLYLLCETEDGNTDIEIYTSALMLIYGGDNAYHNYYSELAGKTIPGKPRFIRGGTDGKISPYVTKNTFVIATDKDLYRFNKTGMVLMDSWDNMFYEKPEVFNPQKFFFQNQCEFLVNNGKLYTLNTDVANSRKFSAPIAADVNNYEAAPYLMKNTMTSWGATPNAINAAQVIYDQKNLRFLPYYAHKATFSGFTNTDKDAYLDANKLPANPKYIFNGGGDQTYCLMDLADGMYLYRYQFFNVADDGDFSADGARSILPLSGCEDIKNAKLFADYNAGAAMYYSSGKDVHAFSPATGETASHKLYTCEGDEEVTALYVMGTCGGGWPTSNVILFVGTWSESTKTGKLVQFEMDHTTGLPNTMWGPMFGAGDENPVITTGWKKIIDMTCLDAE